MFTSYECHDMMFSNSLSNKEAILVSYSQFLNRKPKFDIWIPIFWLDRL